MIYFNLDKNDKKPMYLQIADQVRSMILNNELKYNQKLFSEKEFTYIYNVSEIVVKKAYSVLREEGLVRSVKGLGTFVTNRKVVTLDFSELFNIAGFPNNQSFKTTILTNELIDVDENISNILDVTNEDVYRLNLIVYNHNLPYIYRTIFYKSKYYEMINSYFKEANNILQYFKDLKLKTSIVYNTHMADDIIASMLLINEKDPIASYKLTFINNDEVFMYVDTKIPGDYLIIRKVD